MCATRKTRRSPGAGADGVPAVLGQHFAILSSLFGVLAGLGLYGLMSYNVTNRTREIGICMALGAEQWTIVRCVVRDTVLLVTAGAALGLFLALL